MKRLHRKVEIDAGCTPVGSRNWPRERGPLARLATAVGLASDGLPDLYPFCSNITRAQYAAGTKIGLRCGRLWILI